MQQHMGMYSIMNIACTNGRVSRQQYQQQDGMAWYARDAMVDAM